MVVVRNLSGGVPVRIIGTACAVRLASAIASCRKIASPLSELRYGVVARAYPYTDQDPRRADSPTTKMCTSSSRSSCTGRVAASTRLRFAPFALPSRSGGH